MSINSKSTKAEILAAYKELEKANKNLAVAAKNNNSANSKPVTTNTTNKPSVTQNPQKDMLKTIRSLEQLQVGFGGAVSNLSEQLITEATNLAEIKNAIADEKTQLETLHGLKKIEEDTIDNLIEEYQENAKKFTEELNIQKETDEQEIQELKLAWSKEKEVHSRTIKERNDNYRKTKQREAEEYQYNLDLERDRDEGEYEQEKKQRQKELEETRQELEKQWQEKEDAIAKQEKEYAEAKEKVAAFEEKLRAKIKQGQEEGKGIGSYQAKVRTDLRTKEIEGEKQNYQLRIQALEQTINNQEVRINKLSQQLDASLKQVQDLAVKAIEGTSNRNSFEAMKAIAMEQAKTQQKTK
ncbi:MAG: hypothetical protein Tsb0014_24020 [Pleurocapsa sp.]